MMAPNYGGYGSYGGYSNYGGYQCNPWQSNTAPGYQGTIEDARVGGGHFGWRGGFFGGHVGWNANEGYAIDQNRNGRYDRGRDGVLVFDSNRDGRYDKRDVQSTNNMMQAVQGKYDFNNDGRISFAERIQGNALRAQYRRLDLNRDGVLSTQEIQRGGGKVWQDRNQNGNMTNNELYSPYSMPNSNGWGPSQRLDFVNPFNHSSHTSNNWGWNPSPWGGGGGYPGGNGWFQNPNYFY